MNGTYVLLESNCQTLANLLAQRIAFGPDPMVPFQTISHSVGGGLSRKKLHVLSDFDQAKPTRLNGKLLRGARDPMGESSEALLVADADPPVGIDSGRAINSGGAEDELIDLDEIRRPAGPLRISEVRSNARFWSRDSLSPAPEYERPPPFSLPKGYREWAEKQDKTAGKPSDRLYFEQPPKRFPGPDSPYTKWHKDSVRDHFSRQVEYLRDAHTRAEEIEQWNNPNVPESTRAKVRAELVPKETEWLRKRSAAMANLRSQIAGRIVSEEETNRLDNSYADSL